MKWGWMLAAATALMAGSAEGRVAEKLAVLKPGAVVLMQGDSITDGGRWPGDDFNHIMGQDYAYILAAEIGLTYPERNLIFINRGVGGNTATDLAARWQADTLDLHPDVLSIMVGVNDTFYGKGETLEQYEAVYDKLLADTIQNIRPSAPSWRSARRWSENWAPNIICRSCFIRRLSTQH
jgi:lysophospholipase L1-like esterase